MALLQQGLVAPLGATPLNGGVNFALFSEHAAAVELCLFDENGKERARLSMPGRTGDIFHGFLPDARPGLLYGYRVHGAWQPLAGDRFNANKLLIDPYARELNGRIIWNDALYGYERGHADADLSFDTRDSAPFIPKCVVREPQSSRTRTERPRVPPAERIIYEGHVKGLTRRMKGMPSKRQGSYAALGSKQLVNHLKDLGVTTLELLPIHGFVDDEFLVEKGLVNYWGYQTLTFMAPEGRYAMGGDAVRELSEAIKTLHRQGIEVFLDVVYNHTCEGNELGPHLSFRGIDNRSYYRLGPEQRYYINDTGTGNTLAVEHPRVLQLITDSLRFWYGEMQVDGFRFDLATILGREEHGFDRGAGFFDALHQDPALAEAQLIAEPWDIGPGGYQLGQYPTRWAEWNDKFRDTARRFWIRHDLELAGLADCLLGSGQMFDDRRRDPQASINFVTAHDGSTLADLVSYDSRHNEANGEGNRDGHGHEYSWNHGVEGSTTDADIVSQRERTRRNLMATLMISQGVPMMVAGDEFGRSQQGNNNGYCQDGELTWLNWQLAKSDEKHFLAFVQRLIKARQTLQPLRQTSWLHGRRESKRFGLPETTWLNENGLGMTDGDWHGADARAVCLQLLTDTGRKSIESDCAGVLILINGLKRDWSLDLSTSAVADVEWTPVVDTAVRDGNPAQGASTSQSGRLTAAAESVLLARCYN